MRNNIAALHAKTNAYRRKLKSARAIVTRAFEKCAEVGCSGYVSLSGGKDSTVVFALAREQAPNIPAVWSDDEWFLPETLAYIRRLQSAGHDVRQIRTQAWHAEWLQVSGDYNGIPDYARQQGWRLCFLGLRQEESKTRRLHLRSLGPLFYAKSDGFWHCNPIHDWRWQDVWAYIVTTDTDYNQAYDILERIGVPPEHQRIGPLAVERALGFGQLAILKRGWPDLYNQFCAKFPGASQYT